MFYLFNQFCLCARVGADVRIGCEQDSPLHAGVKGGEASVVDLLLDFGADRCSRNSEGKTPLDLSTPNSAVRIALQKRGMFTFTHIPVTETVWPWCISCLDDRPTNFLVFRFSQVPVLSLSCVGSVFAGVWEGAACTGLPAFSFLTPWRPSSSTSETNFFVWLLMYHRYCFTLHFLPYGWPTRWKVL